MENQVNKKYDRDEMKNYLTEVNDTIKKLNTLIKKADEEYKLHIDNISYSVGRKPVIKLYISDPLWEITISAENLFNA